MAYPSIYLVFMVALRGEGIPQAVDMEFHHQIPYLLVRPCERFAGDGLSGFPRTRVTGECCGDMICSRQRWEDDQSCPEDCSSAELDEASLDRCPSASINDSDLFPCIGDPGENTRPLYYCEDRYDPEGNSECSQRPHRRSKWIESLLKRAKRGELPFALPSAGAKVLELGAGLGQDSRNMAVQTNWSVTAVDVSAAAIKRAVSETKPERLGSAPGQVTYLAYDALALPKPLQPLDLIVDATVYCATRYRYLSRLYSLWRRIATPNYTLIHIQCWRLEDRYEQHVEGKVAHTPKSWRDMAADFEPIFDILHSEGCQKNQGGDGWCFFLKLKDSETRETYSRTRLALQLSARRGDLEALRALTAEHNDQCSSKGHQTLLHIARNQGHKMIVEHLIQSFGTYHNHSVYGTLDLDLLDWAPLMYGLESDESPIIDDLDAAEADQVPYKLAKKGASCSSEFGDGVDIGLGLSLKQCAGVVNIRAACSQTFSYDSSTQHCACGHSGTRNEDCVEDDAGGHNHSATYTLQLTAGLHDADTIKQLRYTWEIKELELHGVYKPARPRTVNVLFKNLYSRQPVHLFLHNPQQQDQSVLVIPPLRERRLLAVPEDVWLLRAGPQPSGKVIKQCSVANSGWLCEASPKSDKKSIV